MFYRNEVLLKDVKRYKLSYTSFASGMNTEVDENLLPHKQAKLVFNYASKNGALKTGHGFRSLTLPWEYPEYAETDYRVMQEYTNEGITNLWHYRYYNQTQNKRNHLILYTISTGQVCFWYVTGMFENSNLVPNVTFTSVPVGINYRLNGQDKLILCSATDGMYVLDQQATIQHFEDAPKLVSMCLHYERLFAITEGERIELVFSANLDPTCWDYTLDDAGFIQMIDERGSMCSVISFNDYVYVFRDYGVARVSAYGAQEEFSVSQLFVSSVKIYGGTVTSCGDRVMFLAKDGIHVFDGSSTTKLVLGIETLFEDVDNENARGLFYNGKYYLACKLNYDDGESIGCEAYSGGYVNNTLIEYDLKTGEVSLTRGVDIKNMISLEEGEISRLIACFNGEHKTKIGELTNDGKVFGTALPKVWISPYSNLGYPNKTKQIREVVLKSKYDCNIKIRTDAEEKTYAVKGSEVTQRVKTNVKGELVEISFITNGADAEISAPEIVLGITS